MIPRNITISTNLLKVKFFIAVVLALAVCGFANAQQMGSYTPIQWDSNNQQLVDTLNYGFEQAVPEAIAAGQIGDEKWNCTNMVSVQEQIVAGINYDFIVVIVETT